MKKLIFRILGALSSALIIVSVFIPFVSVTGYSQSLWQSNEALGTLYLPIMIIVFGAIGVIFFSINIKTELAYTSSGALIFFLIMQTVHIIDQGAFKSLSVGYYCLAVGTFLTGVMAFLCNLKTRQKEVVPVKQEVKEISVINQLDKLYDNQVQVDTQVQNMVDNVIQPLQIQPNLSNNINPVITENTTIELDQNKQPNINLVTEVIEQPQNVVENSVQVQELQQPQIIEQAPKIQNAMQQPLNSGVNPVVSEFSIPTQNLNNESNLVVSEFSTVTDVQASTQELTVVEANPVVSEFTMPSIQPQVNETIVNPVIQPNPNFVEPVQQENVTPKVDVMAEPTNNSSNNLDIFG